MITDFGKCIMRETAREGGERGGVWGSGLEIGWGSVCGSRG